MSNIRNAAPIVYFRGTEDASGGVIPLEGEDIGQHIPKVYFYAASGKPGPQLYSSATALAVYGERTFNARDKFYNFATIAADLSFAQANKVMCQRIIPADAKKATLVLWMSTALVDTDILTRDANGNVVYDNVGGTTVDETVPGAKVEWQLIPTTDDWATIQSYGPITSGPNPEDPKLVPVLALQLDDGEYGNNYGLRIWPTEGDEINTSILETDNALTFNMAVIKREDAFSSPVQVKTVFGEDSVEVTFKPGVLHQLTGNSLYVGDAIVDNYTNTTDSRYSFSEGPFNKVHVFDDQVETMLTELSLLEGAVTQPWADFIGDTTDLTYKFNALTGKTKDGKPYGAIDFTDPTPAAVSMTRFTNHYASGGDDGTMNDADFNTAVRTLLNEYADPNSEVQDIVTYPEKQFYDTGYELETKYAMMQVMAIRKNTIVHLSTHTSGEDTLTAAEEYSIAQLLRTRALLYPESEFFGTSNTRCFIWGHSGKLRNHPYKLRLPLLTDIITKSARYMGAGNGKWKSGQSFDRAPRNVIESMYDISMPWIPNSNRVRNWDTGLNFALTYQRGMKFFPGMQSVYPDDTSVLNSLFTVTAIAELQNIAHGAWREYAGSDTLTDEQLVERVNNYIRTNVAGKFDERFVIEPGAYISENDELRGFSWTLPIKIYANNMKTVMTTWVTAHRRSDLA